MRSLRLCRFVVLMAALSPAVSEAAIIEYSSRAAFAAAVSGEVVEGWDGLADGTTIGTLDGITYSPSAGTAVVSSMFLSLSAPNVLGDSSNANFFGSTESMTFTFSFPITAFGISVNTFATSTGSYTLTTDLGDVAQSYFDPFPGFATGQFAGFVSTAPFTTVVITPQDGFAYNLDDLTYVAVQDVPEPATLLLVGLGLGVAGRRFRKGA